ncbi:hypothetical protein GQ457_17G011280 [Hibiscus cannabinus]
MGPILPSCIADNQAAFVRRCNIVDNILIAHEIIHSQKTIGTRPYQGAAIKLTWKRLSTEWNGGSSRKSCCVWGFSEIWVGLIMRCISTVSFSVRVNGSLSLTFSPERGLRQGDPLSPFLFLICTQGLSSLLMMEHNEGRLGGLCASRNGPKVNHLLFVDDSMLFIRNSTSEAQRLKHILHLYTQTSGQLVNYDKSTVYFSPNIPASDRDHISTILHIREVHDPGIYLRVPLAVGINKNAAFGFVRDKVNSRISSWKKILLSFGGREIFIKAVAQSLP